jgi:ankyrin repeat protein
VSYLAGPLFLDTALAGFREKCKTQRGTYLLETGQKKCNCLSPSGESQFFDPNFQSCKNNRIVNIVNSNQSVSCSPLETDQVVEKINQNLKGILAKSSTNQVGKCSIVETKTRLANGNSVVVDPLSVDMQSPNLSPFWAQEYVGADLAYEFTQKQSPNSVKVGVIDIGVERQFLNEEHLSKEIEIDPNPVHGRLHHGAAVTNLIVSNPQLSPSPSTQIVAILLGNNDGDPYFNSDILKKACKKIQRLQPSLTNISMGMDSSAQSNDLLQALSLKTLIVQSAGNDYPKPVEANLQKLEELNKVIVVGSIAPNGFMSKFSQEGRGVTISAPSDSYIQSISKDAVSNFGGTSGAAPLVTGALANVQALLPSNFRLNPEEAKKLLQNTAVHTLNALEIPQMNGAGMLNAYKLVRVAERLRDKKWSEFTPRDRIQSLDDPQLYDFNEEALQSLESAKKLFSHPENCQDMRQGLKLLRMSYLLNSGEESRALLERVFRKNGFESNSEFYESLGPMTDLKRGLLANPKNKLHVMSRLLKGQSTESRSILSRLVEHLAEPDTKKQFIDIGYTPLQMALDKNEVELAKFLIQNMTAEQIREEDASKKGIFSSVIKSGSSELLQEFIDKGELSSAYIKKRDEELSLLMLAVYQRNLKMIQLIIQKGNFTPEDVSRQSYNGDTPLFASVRRSNIAALMILIEEGHLNNDQIHMKDKRGLSPFLYAVSASTYKPEMGDIIKVLVKTAPVSDIRHALTVNKSELKPEIIETLEKALSLSTDPGAKGGQG